jgi:hypothetical protein
MNCVRLSRLTHVAGTYLTLLAYSASCEQLFSKGRLWGLAKEQLFKPKTIIKGCISDTNKALFKEHYCRTEKEGL